MNHELGITISGRVIRGDGYGKKLGFPTANLDRREYIRKKMKIRFGVWAGIVIMKLKRYKAAMVIGPLDKHRLPKIEAHVLNFKGNLYGQKVTIILQKYLRPFKKYKSIDDLKKQIKQDILRIKKP